MCGQNDDPTTYDKPVHQHDWHLMQHPFTGEWLNVCPCGYDEPAEAPEE